MRALAFILCLAAASCATHSQPQADGVDQRRASVIADDYLWQHMAATFGHVGPYDGGTVWIFKITGDVVPFELTNIPPVMVDKKSGDVTWEAKPPLKR